MRRLLRSRSRGVPLVRVSPDATFTLRALSGGYAFSLATTHHLEAQPVDNTYALLMNGVESLISLACQANFSDADDGANFATAADGRRYRSARVQD
jgi:hypothetical protein